MLAWQALVHARVNKCDMRPEEEQFEGNRMWQKEKQ